MRVWTLLLKHVPLIIFRYASIIIISREKASYKLLSKHFILIKLNLTLQFPIIVSKNLFADFKKHFFLIEIRISHDYVEIYGILEIFLSQFKKLFY